MSTLFLTTKKWPSFHKEDHRRTVSIYRLFNAKLKIFCINYTQIQNGLLFTKETIYSQKYERDLFTQVKTIASTLDYNVSNDKYIVFNCLHLKKLVRFSQRRLIIRIIHF